MRSSLLRTALVLVLAGTALTGLGRLTAVHADSAHPLMVSPCDFGSGQICISASEPPAVPLGQVDISGAFFQVPAGVLTLTVVDGTGLPIVSRQTSGTSTVGASSIGLTPSAGSGGIDGKEVGLDA